MISSLHHVFLNTYDWLFEQGEKKYLKKKTLGGVHGIIGL